MKLFETRQDAVAVLFLLCVSCALGIKAFYPLHTGIAAEERMELHRQVLAGTAPAPYQYQMWAHSWLLDRLLRFRGKQDSAAALRKLYAAYYMAGFLVAVVLLYGLGRSLGAPAAAAAAVLQFLAACPLFWFDNWYHPGDPYGLALLCLLVWLVAAGRARYCYLALLFASGFVWEKAVLLPLSVAGYQMGTLRRRDWKTVWFCLAGLAASSAGQITTRLLYGTERQFLGTHQGVSLSRLIQEGVFLGAIFGVALYQQYAARRSAPPLYHWLSLQFWIWLGIYAVTLREPLTEMRSLIGMVAVLMPFTVAFYQDLSGGSLRRDEVGGAGGVRDCGGNRRSIIP